ncbi:GxxExxY protein [Litoribacter ruber]|uniref:GxxExxY protein n=1 Tax=Litoribacter ruber TaxID=702568 RepID=UPI001BD93B9A|nr:GxxExxY protein [Litoribacter ruber]MBT0811313.1 GxxExxY protein [Litoribacter ruber]
MEIDKITEKILFCAFRVHSELGPGLLESTYEKCLAYELIEQGLTVEQQKILPLTYKKLELQHGYRLDLQVEGKVIVEVKAVEKLTEVHVAQVLTYLKLTGCKVGLLLNFQVDSLKTGIRRVSKSK